MRGRVLSSLRFLTELKLSDGFIFRQRMQLKNAGRCRRQSPLASTAGPAALVMERRLEEIRIRMRDPKLDIGVDGRNPVNSPVEVDSLSHYFLWVSYIPGGDRRISSINSRAGVWPGLIIDLDACDCECFNGPFFKQA